METKTEITRTVSLLRSLLRSEMELCGLALDAQDFRTARRELSEVRDKLVRAVNVLNRLR